MQTKTSLRGSVALYFALVFGITWSGIALLTVPAQSLDSTARVGLIALPMLLTPAGVSLVLTWMSAGRSGLQALGSRMSHWRVSVGWYAVALGGMPVIILGVLGLLTVGVSPIYRPALSWMGLAGIVAGFLEEIGWTGYAIPRLLKRWSAWQTGLWLGLLWGLWHAMADYTIRGSSHGAFWPITFALFVLPLCAWRLIMVRIYARTPSGLIAQLLHFSYTGSLALFEPALAPAQTAWIYGGLTIVLWLIVAVIYGRQQQDPQSNERSECSSSQFA